ncbi:MAG: aspartyl protease family protein [Anaerolineae bacterium]|nr:aspartyl protease family protein [Anaerolineae bacterium]
MSGVPIRITDGLPLVAATIRANGQELLLENLLLDTGSGGTVLKADHLIRLGVVPLPTDRLRFLRGVGGDEAVIEKTIDALQVGSLAVEPFIVQMGAMDYGVPMDGIVGLDFLYRAHAIIDFGALQVR